MRALALAAMAALLAACGPRNVTMQRDGTTSLNDFHRIGVLPFKDAKGHGDEIAGGIEAGLQKLLFEAPDQKKLEALALQYKLDPHSGIDLEAVEAIRNEASADAVIMGVMAPDWSAVSFVVADMQMGEPVLKFVVRPARKKESAFADTGEVVTEALKALASAR